MEFQTIQLPNVGPVRAVETGDPLTNFTLGIDGPVADLMVGQPKLVTMLGESLYRTIRVPTVAFQYQKFGVERFETKDAERHMRAEFQFSELEVDTLSGKLVRYGWGALLDRDEIANSEAFEGIYAMQLRIRERHQNLSRSIVDMSLEKKRADAALAAASYSQATPDLDVTVGTAWDAVGGDSKTDVRAVASLLAAQNGVQMQNIEVFLTHQALEAAQEDPTFSALRGNFATAVPNEEDLRSYWGVGRVTVGDAYEANAAGDGVTSMYGDVAILKVMQPLLGYDDREGQLDSFVKFKWRIFGRPLMPWFIEKRTSWAFPWEDWEQAENVNTTAAAILRGVQT